MAKTIQVRDVPDDVHAELRKRAAEASVSLSDYVLDELRRVASRSRNAEVLIRSSQRDWSLSRQEIVEAVREGRNDR